LEIFRRTVLPFSPKKPRPPLDEAALFDYAVKALGRRMRTEAELRKLLHTRVEPEESGAAKIHTVVTRLCEYGYLSDTSYAETYTRLRQENDKFGERRVRQDLKQKGVPEAILEEAITARYGQTDEAALARQFLERKRLKPPQDQKETARIMRRLIMAGFSAGTIRKVLSTWKVDDESLLALDALEEEIEDS